MFCPEEASAQLGCTRCTYHSGAAHFVGMAKMQFSVGSTTYIHSIMEYCTKLNRIYVHRVSIP